MISMDGEYFDVIWCLISYPWVEEPELQERLDRSFPFRPVKQSIIPGYRFLDDLQHSETRN